MAGWQQFIFPAGLLLLAHSVYLALRSREQLQAHHHHHLHNFDYNNNNNDNDNSPSILSSYFPFTTNTVAGGPTAYFNASTIPIFVELLLGMVIVIMGHVRQSSFRRARLIDKNCEERYDDVMYTGVGFMHFNHRGARLEKLSNGAEASGLAAKKKV